MHKSPAIRPRVWHKQQELILKSWGESCSCYRHMHYRSHLHFRRLTMRYMLPIIIISTVTGTVNFSNGSFPIEYRSIIPFITGTLNLLAAVLTTVMQFLKLNELTESHRASFIQFGKLTRNIRIELTLPVHERSHDGSDMMNICRAEYDRLLEQCPQLPGKIISEFEDSFPLELEDGKTEVEIKQRRYTMFKNMARPEILFLRPIEIYAGSPIIDEPIYDASPMPSPTTLPDDSFSMHDEETGDVTTPSR